MSTRTSCASRLHTDALLCPTNTPYRCWWMQCGLLTGAKAAPLPTPPHHHHMTHTPAAAASPPPSCWPCPGCCAPTAQPWPATAAFWRRMQRRGRLLLLPGGPPAATAMPQPPGPRQQGRSTWKPRESAPGPLNQPPSLRPWSRCRTCCCSRRRRPACKRLVAAGVVVVARRAAGRQSGGSWRKVGRVRWRLQLRATLLAVALVVLLERRGCPRGGS